MLGMEPGIIRRHIWLDVASLWHHYGAMDLTPFVAGLHEQLAAAAETGGPEARRLAERLSTSLDSAARLALLEVLSAAAAEITQEIAPASVDVRLRGRDPELVVTAAPAVSPAAEQEPEPVVAAADDAAMTRINLRLPQDLKDRVEDSARAAGISVNAWLVRVAAAAAARPAPASPASRTVATGGDRFRGWVR